MKKQAFALILAAICILNVFAFSACTKQKDPERPEDQAYAVSLNGKVFTAGDRANEIIASFADLNPAISESSSCLAGVGGKDISYVYQGYTVKTFKEEKDGAEEKILWIILTDDSHRTQEGFAIGDSAEAVKAHYGTPAFESESLLTFVKKGVKLSFDLRDGTVTKIAYSQAE